MPKTTPPTNYQPLEAVYLDTADMAKLLSVSTSTLKVWRLGQGPSKPPLLIEGAHWISLGCRKTLYHRVLMLDFVATHHRHPQAHAAVVEAFLAGLPSSRLFSR
jgi:hypothetical protein